MSIVDVSGIWTGMIIYGNDYRKNSGKKLYFDLELFQNEHEITGKSIDTTGYGVNPLPATIKGTIADDRIRFIKQYPNRHFTDSKGTEHLVYSKKGFKIEYTGTYNDLDNSFHGNWIINGQFKLLGLFTLKFKNTGSWTMTKKHNTKRL